MTALELLLRPDDPPNRAEPRPAALAAKRSAERHCELACKAEAPGLLINVVHASGIEGHHLCDLRRPAPSGTNPGQRSVPAQKAHRVSGIWDHCVSRRDRLGEFVGTRDRRFLLWTGLAIAAVVSAVFLLLRVFGLLGGSNEKSIAAALTFLGVVITACVSLLGLAIKRQAERRLDQAEERMSLEQAENDARLRLDAAMRAGELFNTESTAAPAAAASGLLALTELGRADLSVALLVDLWDTGASPAAGGAETSNGEAAHIEDVDGEVEPASVHDVVSPSAIAV